MHWIAAFTVTLSVLPSSAIKAAKLSPSEAAPECKSGPDYPGSLHAATSYEVPAMDPPGGKEHASFTCQGKPAAVYLYDYAPDGKVGVGLFAARLWGGPAPTEAHPDELLRKDTVVAVVSGPASPTLIAKLLHKGFALARGGNAPTLGSVADRFKGELDCSPAGKDPLRAWCPVTRLSSAGFHAPPKPQTWVGVTVALRTDAKLREALLSAVSVSALSLGAGKISVRDIKPENADEQKELLGVAMSVAGVLKGAKTQVTVPAGLRGFLGSLTDKVATQGYAVGEDAHGARFIAKNPSTAYQLKDPTAGEVYVVVEDAPDGTWVSVYPAGTAQVP